MSPVWIIPGVLQAIAIAVDEFHFHRKRGLVDWELVGHPVDTFFFVLPIGLSAACVPTENALDVYVALAVLSCFLVTKDEFVHARVSTPAEHWIHSVLFVLHPVVFFAGEKIWRARGVDPVAQIFLKIQLAAAIVFLGYQLLCWKLKAAPISSGKVRISDSKPGTETTGKL